VRFIVVDSQCRHNTVNLFDRHQVRYFNPLVYMSGAIGYPTTERIVSLHRSNDKNMEDMLSGFKAAVKSFDSEALLSHQNWFPPEWLVENTGPLARVLGCFDDPHKTYTATVPALWAYHGAYFCSPSYSRTKTFRAVLEMFGMKNTHWFPLSYTKPTADLVAAVEKSWGRRKAQVIYIGKCYGSKVDKLAQFNRGINGQLKIFGGNWPLAGLAGFVAPLRGRKFFPKWVRSISQIQRQKYYLESLIGLNMHQGDGEETGNMRMYEVPMHGAMLLCDKAGLDMHKDIFKPDIEAVYYDCTQGAIEKCLYYFKKPNDAIKIAQKGFEKAKTHFKPEKVMVDLLNWVEMMRK
jgi:hypothetical protein